jgi:hypothetical protein
MSSYKLDETPAEHAGVSLRFTARRAVFVSCLGVRDVRQQYERLAVR